MDEQYYGCVVILDKLPHFFMYNDGGGLSNGVQIMVNEFIYTSLEDDEAIIVGTRMVLDDDNQHIFTFAPLEIYKTMSGLNFSELQDLDLLDMLVNSLIEKHIKLHLS